VHTICPLSTSPKEATWGVSVFSEERWEFGEVNKTRVFGEEKLSASFLDDLRVLLEIDPKTGSDLSARWATERLFGKEELLEAIATLGLSPEKNAGLARIVQFYAQSLQRGTLPAASDQQIETEFASLGLDAAAAGKFQAFIASLALHSEEATKEAARTHWLRVGCPRIQGATATCDFRCVYELVESSDEDSDDEGPPKSGRLLGLEPVVLLEFLTTLNDTKENHVFQATEKELDQLIVVLRRARQRCVDARRQLREGGASKLFEEGTHV